MKRYFLVAFTVIVFASIAEAQGSVRATIEANNKKFIEAFNKGDAKTVASMYAADARLMPPNADIIQDRASIEKYWAAPIAAKVKMSALDTVNVETSGNMAVEVGHYTLEIPGANGTTTDKGKYVVVWKKEGGNWKIAVDTFNTSLPATGP